MVIGFPPCVRWDGKLIVLTFEDEPLEEWFFELDDEALTIDNEEVCLDEELVLKDDMDKLLFESVVCFLLK